MIDSTVLELIRQRHGEELAQRVPPPVFWAMGGELLEYEPTKGILKARFPVLPQFLNPYGSMQGGMIAAAIDNTLGPLSMLVAPPNVTRRLEIKYSRPATPDHEHIVVRARFRGREGHWLSFDAIVRDKEGRLVARARARHWIVEQG